MKKFISLVNPIHIKKYKGNPDRIVMRSSWEYDFFLSLLASDKVTWVASEYTVIKYRWKIDGRIHRYFMDFTYETCSSAGRIKKWLCEVKPFARTQAPIRFLKSGKERSKTSYAMDFIEYTKNINKWQAALDFCRAKGYNFIFLTDDPMNTDKYRLWKYQELKLPLR